MTGLKAICTEQHVSENNILMPESTNACRMYVIYQSAILANVQNARLITYFDNNAYNQRGY